MAYIRTPEIREKNRQATLKKLQNPEYRASIGTYERTPEIKDKIRKGVLKRYEDDPLYRESVRASALEPARIEALKVRSYGNTYGSRDVCERFWDKVEFGDDVSDGCWEWLGSISVNGYGKFYYNGRVDEAHRVSYSLFVGPIPEGLTIDHLCRNCSCVNYGHMELVTLRENILRSRRP